MVNLNSQCIGATDCSSIVTSVKLHNAIFSIHVTVTFAITASIHYYCFYMWVAASTSFTLLLLIPVDCYCCYHHSITTYHALTCNTKHRPEAVDTLYVYSF